MQGTVVARDHCGASSSNQGSFRKKCLVSWPFKSHDVNTYTNKLYAHLDVFMFEGESGSDQYS